MKMIEMGVGYEDRIEGRKILDAQAGPAQTLEDKKPGREDRIDDDVRSANLQEK